MKFYYSADGEHLLAQPADECFYPFPAEAKPSLSQAAFDEMPFNGYDTYEEAQKAAAAAGIVFPELDTTGETQ